MFLLFRTISNEYPLLHHPINLSENAMPGITLQLSGHEDPQLAHRLANALTKLTCRILDKRPEQTMVIVRFVPAELWFINGQSLQALARHSFRLEVTVTDETNTRAQKAQYHQEVYALLAETLGELHEHSNIHIIDCRAGAYGYGGVTQEFRYQHNESFCS
jgi:4-oxalocrotonate tautomerase